MIVGLEVAKALSVKQFTKRGPCGRLIMRPLLRKYPCYLRTIPGHFWPGKITKREVPNVGCTLTARAYLRILSQHLSAPRPCMLPQMSSSEDSSQPSGQLKFCMYIRKAEMFRPCRVLCGRCRNRQSPFWPWLPDRRGCDRQKSAARSKALSKDRNRDCGTDSIR